MVELHIEHFIFILAVLFYIIILLYIYKNSQNNNIYILQQLTKTPIPLLLIDVSVNEVIFANKLMLSLLELEKDLPTKDLSKLNIFSKFEDYLELKESCREKKSIVKKILNINTMLDHDKIIEVHANYFILGYKKYMMLVFNDKNDYFETIRYFGVFSSIVEESPDGIIISRYTNLNETPTIMYMNKELTNLTGYSCEEMLGKPLFNLFNLNVNDETLMKIESNIQSFKPTTIEYQYIKKNGEVSWVESDIIPITNNNINESLLNVTQNKIYNDKIYGAINSTHSYNNELYITIHQKDITREQEYEHASKNYIEKIQNIIKEKTSYYESLMDSLISMIENKNKDTIINKILTTLGNFLDVDRVLMCNIYEKNDKKMFSIKYEWAKNNFSLEKNNDLFIDVDILNIGAYELYTSLISNRTFQFNIDDTTHNTVIKYLFNTLNAKSVITRPIFNDNKLDSFLILIDCENKHRFWNIQAEKFIENITRIIGIYLKNSKSG